MSASQSSRRDALTALGYEVTGNDVIHAYKAHGQSLAYAIVIDNSGQMRFTATRLVEPTKVVHANNLTRPYRISREQQTITTIMYELTDKDDVADVVRELERISIGS